ncbi:MAG: hypothetical protein JNM57_13015 [Cyclobacteriaceae bacterium]|nr:hypothetical protein [Cyclobacteriaceae bacterium]
MEIQVGIREVVLIAWLWIFFSLSGCDDDVPVGVFNQVTPVADATGVSITPAFSWNDATGADSYHLLLSRKDDFSTIEIEKSGLEETRYTLTEPLAKGYRYYWKVIARNADHERIAENAGLSFRVLADQVQPSPLISNYYVSPAGEDNPDRGSIEKPFKTLAYAATQVPADENDTIVLLAGTFIETEPAVIPLGVNVTGAGQDKTILSSTGVAIPRDVDPKSSQYKFWYDGSLIQLVSPHRSSPRNNNSPALPPANGNQVISNLTIDGNTKSLKAGVWVENRSNVELHHLTFKNLAQRGAVVAGGNKNWFVYPEYYLKDIRIHDCVFINSGKDLPDESLGNLNIAQLDGAEIYNITIQDNEGYGIKFIYDGYFKNTKIHDCTISLNESDAKWGEDIAIELWNIGPGNEIYRINCNTWLSLVNHPEIFGSPNGTENMHVREVKIIDQDGNSNKEAVEIGAPGIEVSHSYIENKGFGMAIWDMGRKNITIRNTIFYNTTQKENWASGAAIYIDNSRSWMFQDIHIYNNVFDTHKVAIKATFTGAGISNVQIKNNAFLNVGQSELEAMGSTISFFNNLKFKEGSATWSTSGTTALGDNVIGAPLFNNTGSRWDTFYRPSTINSFVVDKGINVGLPFSGSAPDIGAFEF